MARLTVVPVIPLALSDARKTATFAVSSSVMTRRGWVVLARNPSNCAQVMPDALARIPALRDRTLSSAPGGHARRTRRQEGLWISPN